jgi:flagellum-specific peptidoglycan hydrolase FlgJ
MPDNDVRINIRSSFSSEGADDVKSDARELREEFEHLADSIGDADAMLRERYASAVEDAARQTSRAAEVMAQVGPFSGILFADVARQAIQAGDLDAAISAIMQGYKTDEPRAILQRLQQEVLEARRATADVDPKAPEPELGDPRSPRIAEQLRRRVEDAIPTVEANLVLGRAGGAERSLGLAEQYLEQLRQLEGNTAELKALGGILGKHRESLEDLKTKQPLPLPDPAQPPSPVDMEGFADTLVKMMRDRGLGGAGSIGGMVGRLGRFLGPWGMALTGVTVAAGAAHSLLGRIASGAREAREEALAFHELAREFGADESILQHFLNIENATGFNVFRTSPELQALRYTTTEAGRFAAQYGVMAPNVGAAFYRPTRREVDALAQTLLEPGGDIEEARRLAEAQLRNNPPESGSGRYASPYAREYGLYLDTVAGLGLARATGIDESQIAALMRNAALVGTFEPGFAEQLARVLFQAVRDGTAEGVSASETLVSMKSYFERLAASGIRGDIEGSATIAMLQQVLNESANRTLRGESGARALTGMITGMTELGDPGLELFMQRAFAGLTAEDVGLSGEEAVWFEQLSPVVRGRIIAERAQAGNYRALEALGAQYSGAFGENQNLQVEFAQQYLGLSRTQALSLLAEHGGDLFRVFTSGEDVYRQSLQRYEAAQISDEGIGGEGALRRMAIDAEQRAFIDAERERVGSYVFALQNFDVAITETTLRLNEFWRNLAGIVAGLRQDPLLGRYIGLGLEQLHQDELQRGVSSGLIDQGAYDNAYQAYRDLGMSHEEARSVALRTVRQSSPRGGQEPEQERPELQLELGRLNRREPLTREELVLEMYEAAVRLREAGYPINPAVLTAQVVLESGYLDSELAWRYNNPAGAKAGRGWTGETVNLETTENTPTGEEYRVRADFRVYGSFEEALLDYERVMQLPWYAESVANPDDIERYIQGLMPIYDAAGRQIKPGYATDVNYDRKLDNIIRRHGLDERELERLQRAHELPERTASGYEPPAYTPPESASESAGAWIEVGGNRFYQFSEAELDELMQRYLAQGMDERRARDMATRLLETLGPQALEGYRRGGFTGWGGRDEVAGLVHRGEFVVNAESTERYQGLLERLNAGDDHGVLLSALRDAPTSPESSRGGESSIHVHLTLGGEARLVGGNLDEAGRALADYLTPALERWGRERFSPWNAGHRRGE